MAGPRADGGYLVITRLDGQVREFKTHTCNHCQKIIVVRPGHTPEGGWCGMCGKAVCGPCCDDGRCVPFEAKLEAAETRAARRRALEMLGV